MLLWALESLPEDLWPRIVAVQVAGSPSMEAVARGLGGLQGCCNAVRLELKPRVETGGAHVGASIGSEGAWRLAEQLGQCWSLAVLQLDGNDIGTGGTGGLVFVLGQCVSLAGLHLGGNGIRAERERGLERVIGQCTALENAVACSK